MPNVKAFLPPRRGNAARSRLFPAQSRVYELRYHLVKHPESVQIPLGAILHLLHDRDRRQPTTFEGIGLNGANGPMEPQRAANDGEIGAVSSCLRSTQLYMLRQNRTAAA